MPSMKSLAIGIGVGVLTLVIYDKFVKGRI